MFINDYKKYYEKIDMLLKEKQQKLSISELVDENNNLTKRGIYYNKMFYNTATSYEMICRCNTIRKNIKNGKKEHICFEPFYKDKKSKTIEDIIKYNSSFTSLRNCVQVLTGKLHGGYIGIDVDIKNKTPGAVIVYYDILIESKELEHTLTCITPSGGYHFVYKVSEEQKKILGDEKFGSELELFDCDIDVLYNVGRFTMSGAYIIDGKQYIYRTIDDSKPSILPNVVFQEILKKLKKEPQKIIKTINKSENKQKNSLNEKIDMKEEEILKQEYTKNDINLLIPRLNILDLENSNQYGRWFSICHIINNMQGSLRLFIEFSKKLKDYDFDECIQKWNENNKNHQKQATIKRLNEFCLQDNPEKYEELFNNEGGELKKLLNELYEIGGVSDNNFAKIFHFNYPDLFIYDPLATFGQNRKEGTWLTYNENGIYHICDGMQKAKKILSNEIYELLENDYNERLSILIATSCEDKIINNLKKKGDKILTRVKNTSSKCQIVEQLKEFYQKEKIFEKLDEINPYLIGFDNGVYDLENREFRKARSDELIHITTGYEYCKAEQKHIDKLNGLINNIYKDENERKYEMTVFSFCLSGIMHLQEFYMIIGNGGNGKGIITLLIKLVMGNNYCTSISIECFKNKGNISANEKSQQLAGCKNARIVFITECEFKENEEFESNLVKSMSGGDEQNCKFLYKEQTKYIPKFNLYFVTNDQIPMKIKDRSLPRRARICPHRISFMDENEYDKKNPNQALAIVGLEEKLRKNPAYKYAFFEILIKYYFDFVDNGKKLEIPQSLINENINFKRLNDPIGNFINDCLIISNNDSNRLKISLLAKLLQDYDKSSNETLKSIEQYFKKKDIKVTIIKGYATCSGICLKEYNIIKEKLSAESVNTLIDLKLIVGEKLQDNEI